mmetsp:Transcript_4755/g.12508  ORF Transcript_4755/g.12508 Transcript_4755/m.12508 type:complete len:91 (+) Transcript_4755:245-517(+)
MFHVVGTPTDETWAGWSTGLGAAYVGPRFQPQKLAALLPSLPADALDLLGGLLRADPGARLTAAQALRHRYFDEAEASRGCPLPEMALCV